MLGAALPDRLSVVTDGVAAALLAFGLDQVRATVASVRWLAVAATAVAVLACLPLIPRPLPAASAPRLPAGWSAAFAALRLPPQARVLVVPVPTAILTAALRWQADTGDPALLVGGYFVGPAWNGLAYIDGNGVAVTAQYLDELWSGGPVPQAPPRSQVDADLPPGARPPSWPSPAPAPRSAVSGRIVRTAYDPFRKRPGLAQVTRSYRPVGLRP